MKSALILASCLISAVLRAGATEAESPVFGLDTRDLLGTTESESGVYLLDTRSATGTTESESGVFALDARSLGNGSSGDTGLFVLNTLGSTLANLEIVGPSTVVAGSQTDYKVIWHVGNSHLDVTSGARWRFLTRAPGNTGMVTSTFYAGETTVAATVKIVASYAAITGRSQETPPFSVTITPRIQANPAATRQGTTGVVNFTTGVLGASGTVTVNWDLDRDGQFDDATGPTVTRDYGTWTGSTKVKVEVIDAQGNRRVEERDVVINKPPVANQPVPARPAYDPGGFSLFLPNQERSPFVFNAGGSNRKDSGLVVIAHGLGANARSDWLREMGEAVEYRCEHLGMIPPDIALLDWSEWAEDPSEMPEWQKKILKNLMEKGLKSGNWTAVATGAAGEAINFGFDLWWVKKNGLTTGQMLANWIYLNSRVGAPPQIDPDKPIHLIGHSAGGFVVGEAARLLKHPQNAAFQPVHVDLVTMLDTPFPPKEHLALGDKRYPNPGTVERYISSFYGDLDEPLAWFTSPHTWYRRTYKLKSWLPFDTLNPYENGHGYSYVWFTRNTTWNADDPDAEIEWNGFAWSPIINPATRISKPYTPPQASPGPRSPAPPEYPDIVPTGWQTFGIASESTGTWTLSEDSDAGIWKEVALPATAATLEFDFHFSNAGDGDFLAVHLGDNPVLYQGLDLPLSRNAWLPAEIPLDLLPQDALSGKLVFTLVSRGGVNAQVQLRNIRITQSEDVDGDGLAVAGETTAGSDPRNPDTDGDGIADGEEATIHFTDPLRSDTDGDGQSDPAELAAGTNPLQNGSYLRVTSVTKSAHGFTLQWTGATGKSYRVLRSQELGTGNFDTLAFGVTGTPEAAFTDSNPPPGRAFYWIEVE